MLYDAYFKPWSGSRVKLSETIMRIGECAARSGCTADTIRYYERAGLLPAPSRGANNYRSYGPFHLERLAFIRRCRSLDMSLAEILGLLRLVERPETECAPVNALLDEHIGHVAARIAELEQLKSELDAIRTRCAGGQRAERCGILRSLARRGPKTSLRDHVEGAHRSAGPRRARPRRRLVSTPVFNHSPAARQHPHVVPTRQVAGPGPAKGGDCGATSHAASAEKKPACFPRETAPALPR